MVTGTFKSMSIRAVGDAAAAVRSLLFARPVSSEDLWRFGILQLLDDYESIRAHNSVDAAARLMGEAPEPTGHSGLDAAFAGLACWLADRDGWDAPAWARAEERVARPWWVVPVTHPRGVHDRHRPSARMTGHRLIVQ